MSRIVYVNGEYLPEEDAKISIFDRGFLMADGVYDVTSVLDGKLIDFDGHAVRLERSLRELEMENPISKEDLLQVHRELVSRNGVKEGMIYLQITRGAPEDRDFVFPDPGQQPSRRKRHQGHQYRRLALGPARYQNRSAFIPFYGKNDGQKSRSG